jgi:hypothetical protein
MPDRLKPKRHCRRLLPALRLLLAPSLATGLGGEREGVGSGGIKSYMFGGRLVLAWFVIFVPFCFFVLLTAVPSLGKFGCRR